MRGLPVAAAVLLVGGFADISRGGITVGPVLLVMAYCVVIPAALLRGTLSRRQRSQPLRLSR
jgi:hypothetical protein